jgi:hypothetical protein
MQPPERLRVPGSPCISFPMGGSGHHWAREGGGELLRLSPGEGPCGMEALGQVLCPLLEPPAVSLCGG